MGNIHQYIEKYAGMDVPHIDPLFSDTWPDWYRNDGGWYEADGDNTRYCVWDLNESSIVFDVGANAGEWSRRMIARYPCIYHLFEPVPSVLERARDNLGHHLKVHLHSFGLGGEDKTLSLSYPESQGGSFLDVGGDCIQAEVRDVVQFVEEREIEHIDLMAINIEGWEYELVPRIIESGMIRNIDRLMIQWHFFNRTDLRQAQQGLYYTLGKTHRMMWNHSALEAWKRRKGDK
jgi:FkbM family methyltransferase